MLNRLLLGAAFILTLSFACANSPSPSTSAEKVIELSNSLALMESANQVPDTVPVIEGDSLKEYFVPTLGLAQKKNIAVIMGPLAAAAENLAPGEILLGYYLHKEKVILLEMAQSPDSLVSTLLHELGHVVQPFPYGAMEGQVFAEAVSYLVCKELGLKEWRPTYAYLHQFPDRHELLLKHQDEIGATVDEFLLELKKK